MLPEQIRRKPCLTDKMNAPIQVEMLGGLRIQWNNAPQTEARVLTRFATHKTGALLAYLAYYITAPPHPRETLAEMLWPDAAPEASRTSLRAALASLRRQLEPPGVPANSVLMASRSAVQLNPKAVTTDVQDWETAWKALTSAKSETPPAFKARLAKLKQAISLYHGDLLPGFYEEWTLNERERLSQAYEATLRELAALSEQVGDLAEAIQAARRLVSASPLDEDAQHTLIRLFVASGQRTAAYRHYAEIERLWKKEFHELPNAATRLLIARSQQTERGSTDAIPAITYVSPNPGANSSPPSLPVMTPPSLASFLPLTLTRFFGREDELAQVQTLLTPRPGHASIRFLTLTGPGGSGKTRLAVEAARLLAPAYGQCVVFTSLADLSQPQQILRAVADSLRMARGQTVETSDREPLEQIMQLLAPYPAALLILDNFEHLLGAEGSETVKSLLARLPALTCLVTSRQRLELTGERELSVSPLPTPVASNSPERLLRFASVQLWTDRAQTARSDFQITPHNAPAVAALCRRLEGIPLALELAASWAQTLTPAQMLTRLESRFDLLVSRHRDNTGRHRSLRAVLDSSYQLLSPPLQAFFAQLSVFRGGWTLAAAETVCQTDEALNFLSRLRDRSLVVTEEVNDVMRFRMLDTIREYAAEQLSPDAQMKLARRHTDYYLRLAEATEPELRGNALAHWLPRLDVEQENMHLVLAREGSDPELALRLAGALAHFWRMRGHIAEGRGWLERLLARYPNTLPATRANALRGAGWLAWRVHDNASAKTFSLESLALSRASGDLWGMAFCLHVLGQAVRHEGESMRAATLLKEAVMLARDSGDAWLLGNCLLSHSHVLAMQGDEAQARAAMEESLSVRRVQGDAYGIAESLRSLGQHFCPTDPEKARAYTRASIALSLELGDVGTAGLSTLSLGFVAYDAGSYAEARLHFDTAYQFCHEVGDRFGMAHAAHNRAHSSLAEGNLEDARVAFIAGLRLFQTLGYEGDIALSLEGLARWSATAEQWRNAALLLGGADRLRALVEVPLPTVHEEQQARNLASARTTLGVETFDQMRQEGREIPTAELLAPFLEE